MACFLSWQRSLSELQGVRRRHRWWWYIQSTQRELDSSWRKRSQAYLKLHKPAALGKSSGVEKSVVEFCSYLCSNGPTTLKFHVRDNVTEDAQRFGSMKMQTGHGFISTMYMLSGFAVTQRGIRPEVGLRWWVWWMRRGTMLWQRVKRRFVLVVIERGLYKTG